MHINIYFRHPPDQILGKCAADTFPCHADPPFLQLELVQLAALSSHPVAGGFPGNRLHADDQGARGEPGQKKKNTAQRRCSPLHVYVIIGVRLGYQLTNGK